MSNFNWKSLLPHLAAIGIFLILIFAYFPELLEGKTLRMDDIEQHKGMSNELANYREITGEEAIWTNAMFGGMPGYIISVIYHGNVLGYGAAIMKLGLPRPADSMFVLMLGMYFLLLVFKVRQPLAIIGSVAYCFTSYNLLIMEAGHMSKVDAISWMPWVLAGVILVFQRKLLLGGVITAIFLSIQIKASHFQITYYMAFILLFVGLFYLIEALKNKELPTFIKSAGVLVIAALFGFLANSSSLITIYDYGKDSIRGKSELTIKETPDGDGLDPDYALQYSYGVGETFSYLIPNVYGGASNIGLSTKEEALNEASAEYRNVMKSLPQYWWDTSSTGPFYAGAVICFLAVLGFFFVEGPHKWAILASCILAILLSWGKNFESFSLFMLDNFPGYNKFRAVKMMLVIVDFLLPLIAVLGLNELYKNPERIAKEKIKFFAAFGLTGGLALIFYLMPDAFFSFDYLNPAIADQLTGMLNQAGYDEANTQNWLNGFMSNLEEVRMHIFKADALRAFLLCAVIAGLVYLYSRMKFNVTLLATLVLILTVGDLWSVDKRYVNKSDFIASSKLEVPFSPSPADEAVFALELRENPALKEQINSLVSEAVSRNKEAGRKNDDAKNRFRALLSLTNYRVLNLASNVFNDAGTSFFHKSVGGYSAAKLERYQEYIEYHLQPAMEEIFKAFRTSPSDSSIQAMLSRQYALNMLNTKYIIYNEKAAPLVNSSALGNAWFINEVQEVASADEEILAMKPGFDPGKLAIVDKRFNEAWSGFSGADEVKGSIEMKSYAPNYIEYESSNPEDGVAIFSEIYYAKGWKAFIDGAEVPHFRANYILRGLKIPSGKHKIEFKFDPELYHTTEAIAMASSSLLVILLLVVLGLQFKRNLNLNKTQD